MELKKFTTAAALSLVLALGLAPGLAQADDAAQQGGQFVAGQLTAQDAPTVDSVSATIKTLKLDPSEYKKSDTTKVMGIQTDYEKLSAADQKKIDEDTSYPGTNQSLGRILESAVWAVGSYEIDNSTTLPDGTYEGSAVKSTSDKGKSTSSRVRNWAVKTLTVKDGMATATLALTDGDGNPVTTQTAIWMGGKEYPCDANDKSLFPNIPINLNGVTYFGGVSSTMPAPTMYGLSVSIELAVDNHCSMFTAADSSLLKGNKLVFGYDSESLSFAYVGTDTQAEAAADADLIPFNKTDKTFDIAVSKDAAAGKPFAVSFKSAKKSTWKQRWFTIDAQAGTLLTADVDPTKALECGKLIDKIYVQKRTETTDADCAAAKAAWKGLSDAEKELVTGENADPDYFGRDTGDASKDDPLNKDDIGENEILVVSFGTSFNDSRVADISAVEKAIQKAYPKWSVRRAFTAQIIINHVQARDEEKIDNVTQAMDRAVTNGVKNLVVQPTHLMYGAEYDELKAEIDKYKDKMTITYAEPLLGKVGSDASVINKDKEAVAKAVVAAACKAANFKDAAAAAEAGTAIVFMGHGTAHDGKITYEQMQTMMDQLGYKNVFIGTVEGEPESTECQAVIAKVKEAGYKNVILRPLMVVAGDHANNDMADEGDPESWVSQFNDSKAFAKVDCQIAGLGEIEDVQNLYVSHTKDAIEGRDIAEATITGVNSSYYYTGKAIEPEPVVTDDHGALVKGDDFIVTYSKNTDASLDPVATVTVTGKGRYKGEASVKFAIVQFADTEGHWALDDGGHNWIQEATDMGLMGGYKTDGKLNGSFGPDDQIKRQDIAVMLYRSANPDSKATTDPEAYAKENTSGWEDCEGGQYYTAAMNWAKEAKVFTGDSSTDYKTVRPGDSISRQELALVYSRYAEGTGKAADGSYKKAAPDADKVAEWAVEGIDWCYTNGVMTGNKETKALNPGDTATRAETAKMTVTTVNIKNTPANK